MSNAGNKNTEKTSSSWRQGPYKIARIIDEYTVVINAGSNRGIEIGDKFEIYENGIEIFDPDTNESLGALDFVKAKIKVETVLTKMSICVSDDPSPLTTAFTSMTMAAFAQTTELNIDPIDISGGYENKTKKIKVGDLVRLINQSSKPDKS